MTRLLDYRLPPVSETHHCWADRESCPHAEQAAERAVAKVFAILGVDIQIPADVEKFRMSLRFSDGMRRASERGRLAIAGTMAITILAAIGYGVIELLKIKLG